MGEPAGAHQQSASQGVVNSRGESRAGPFWKPVADPVRSSACSAPRPGSKCLQGAWTWEVLACDGSGSQGWESRWAELLGPSQPCPAGRSSSLLLFLKETVQQQVAAAPAAFFELLCARLQDRVPLWMPAKAGAPRPTPVFLARCLLMVLALRVLFPTWDVRVRNWKV